MVLPKSIAYILPQNPAGKMGFRDSVHHSNLKNLKNHVFPLFSGNRELYRPAPKGANNKLLFKQHSNIGGGRDSLNLPNKHCARYSLPCAFSIFIHKGEFTMKQTTSKISLFSKSNASARDAASFLPSFLPAGNGFPKQRMRQA